MDVIWRTKSVHGWSLCMRDTTLGQILDETDGSLKTGPFGTKLSASEYSTDGAPVISVGEVGYGQLRVHEKTKRVPISVVERMPEYLLEPGDIVFGRKGAVDRSAWVRANEAGYFLGSDGIRVRFGSGVSSRFMSYQLQSTRVRDWLLQHAIGTTLASLNEPTLRSVPVSVPSHYQQRAIAATLSALDDKIESNRRTSRLLLSLAEGLFAQAIGRGPLSWLPFDEVVHRLTVRHKHSGKTVAASGRTIVLDQGSDGVLGYHGGEPEFIGTPEAPICLFGDHTCTWRLGLGEFDVGPNVIPIVAKDDCRVDPLWMYFGLRGVQKFQEYRRHWMEFKRHKLPWVDQATQTSFVETARPLVAKIHELAAQSERLNEFRDVLLPELLSGRMHVPAGGHEK